MQNVGCSFVIGHEEEPRSASKRARYEKTLSKATTRKTKETIKKTKGMIMQTEQTREENPKRKRKPKQVQAISARKMSKKQTPPKEAPTTSKPIRKRKPKETSNSKDPHGDQEVPASVPSSSVCMSPQWVKGIGSLKHDLTKTATMLGRSKEEKFTMDVEVTVRQNCDATCEIINAS